MRSWHEAAVKEPRGCSRKIRFTIVSSHRCITDNHKTKASKQTKRWKYWNNWWPSRLEPMIEIPGLKRRHLQPRIENPGLKRQPNGRIEALIPYWKENLTLASQYGGKTELICSKSDRSRRAIIWTEWKYINALSRYPQWPTRKFWTKF